MRANAPLPSAGREVQRAAAEREGVAPESLGLTAGQDIALTAMLVLQGILLFIGTPLAALGVGSSRLIISLLLLVFALLVILIARGRTAALVAWSGAGCVAIGAVLVIAAPSSRSFSSTVAVHSASALGMAVCSYVIARALFAPGPITLHRVIGAVVLYLTVGLVFATTYRVVLDIVPDALRGIEAGVDEIQTFSAGVYFSLVTLSSTGYGDIIPIHPIARSLANLESIIGQMYPATLVAALVTQHLEWRRS